MAGFIGLKSSEGIEYNARFLLGDERAEKLEFNKVYTSKELHPALFFGKDKDKNLKWRRCSL